MFPPSSAGSSLRRRAQPKITTRIARSRSPSTVFELGLSKQVALLFPAEPVPCSVAGLADALEGYDSLGRAAIEQPVFGRFCGQLADRRQPQIDGRRAKPADSRTPRYCGTVALLDGGRASGRVPGEE